MGEDSPLINVRRRWNDWKIAVYKLSSISGFNWSNESGGVNAPAPQLFLHGYVMCDGMESGELSHSCAHGPPPHRIKVCILRKGNEAVFPILLSAYPKPTSPPLSDEERERRRAKKALKASGIPPNLISLLLAAGLHTPDEVLAAPESQLKAIRGLGPARWTTLQEWRRLRQDRP